MDQDNGKPTPRTGWLDKLFFHIVGVDEETLRLCPQHDLENVRAIAEIMLFTLVYQTALFSIVSHRIFAAPGQFRPELVLISIFLAAFVMLIDSYMVMRSGWHHSGIEELKRGGLDISGGLGARIKSGVFLAIRILLSLGIAQLTAIFLSLIIFYSDINARIQDSYTHNNANLIGAATAHIDAEINRTTDAVNAESSREAALASQVNAVRQEQIDPSANQPGMQEAQQELAQLFSEKTKADDAVRSAETLASAELAGIHTQDTSGIPGDGPRRRAAMEALTNARSDAREIAIEIESARSRIDALRTQYVTSGQASTRLSQDELPRFESMLKTEDDKLHSLQEQRDSLIANRDTAIQQEIESSPGYLPVDRGLLAQISALEQIAQSDSKIAAVIILIDAISFGFELAAVLAKITSFIPTTYATIIARDAYVRVVLMVDKIIKELNLEASEPTPKSEFPQPTNSPEETGGDAMSTPSELDLFTGLPEPAAPPPSQKRPRGRPPKTPSDDKTVYPFGVGKPWKNGST